MRTITKHYQVYKYNELSEDAKEKVKQWYLDGQLADFFTENCMEDLYNLFGENDLKVQYSLAYCQGDGFNIYGTINANNIFNCLENNNGGCQLEKFKNVLTDKEKRTILNYQSECNNIELQYNNRYCYSLSDRIDIANDWEYDLEWYSAYKNINVKTLEKFEKLVRDIFSTLCATYEEAGYEYFYEVSSEDLQEYCNANEFEFYQDGKLFM